MHFPLRSLTGPLLAAARLAPLNARSDVKAGARYMAEVLAFDGRAGLRQADLPMLEVPRTTPRTTPTCRWS